MSVLPDIVQELKDLLKPEEAKKVISDLKNIQVSAAKTTSLEDRKKFVFNSLTKVLGNEVLQNSVTRLIAQYNAPRKEDDPIYRQSLTAENNENIGDNFIPTPWGDKLDININNIDPNAYRDHRNQAASEFVSGNRNDASAEKLLRAELTYRYALQLKMSPRPGSGGGKRPENEQKYTYESPTPTPKPRPF